MSKKAFLVGINTYAGAPLRGCVNDVLSMSKFLKSKGFSVETALDAQATCTRIISGIKKLVSESKAGDTIVFHYSGHGSQVPDRNRDEADRLDEILCPVNIDFYKGIYITDDELSGLFRSVPKGVTLEVILDCCHSGTGLRDIMSSTPRFLPMPENLTLDTMSTDRALVIEPELRDRANYILWAACSSSETAADAGISPGNYQGAFTYSLLSLLQQAGIKRSTLDKQIAGFMKSKGWPQTPQLECTYNQSNQAFLDSDVATREIKSKSIMSSIKSLFGG